MRWLLLSVIVAPLGCGSADDASTSAAGSGGDAGATSISASSGSNMSSSASASAGSGGATPGPIGNAVLLPDGTVVPIYPVTGNSIPARAIGFRQTGTMLTAIDETGATLWARDEGEGAMFGGFDLDGDGVVDLGFARSKPSGQTCGGQDMHDTSLDAALGKDGTPIPLTAPLASLCWMFPNTTYPTEQWTVLDLLFGPTPGLVAAMPYYATNGSFLRWSQGAIVDESDFDYPSTPAYDAYAAAKPNAHGAGHDYEQYSHVANGLFTTAGGEDRLVFFTTARVLQYRVAPQGPMQLASDTPFLTAGRTDLVGRDYGLVEEDPGAPGHLALVSGTSAYSVYADLRSGMMSYDSWGQIERHVTRYDLASGAVDDRFYSYAHDGGDAYKYEGRVAYPNEPFVRGPEGSQSRLAYDVYEGGHWQLHVSTPGATADAAVLPDMVLWDIRDLDGDGIEDWVLSPVKDPTDPDVPGYYFPKWRTLIAHWNETNLSIDIVRTIPDQIPYLTETFRLPKRTTSFSYLYPALTIANGAGLALLVVDATGKVSALSLP